MLTAPSGPSGTRSDPERLQRMAMNDTSVTAELSIPSVMLRVYATKSPRSSLMRWSGFSDTAPTSTPR